MIRAIWPGKRISRWLVTQTPEDMVRHGAYGLLFKKSGTYHVWFVGRSFIRLDPMTTVTLQFQAFVLHRSFAGWIRVMFSYVPKGGKDA